MFEKGKNLAKADLNWVDYTVLCFWYIVLYTLCYTSALV